MFSNINRIRHDAQAALPTTIKIPLVAVLLLAWKSPSPIVPVTSACRLLDCLFRFGTDVYASVPPAHVPTCTDRRKALMTDYLAHREWSSDVLPLLYPEPAVSDDRAELIDAHNSAL